MSLFLILNLISRILLYKFEIFIKIAIVYISKEFFTKINFLYIRTKLKLRLCNKIHITAHGINFRGKFSNSEKSIIVIWICKYMYIITCSVIWALYNKFLGKTWLILIRNSESHVPRELAGWSGWSGCLGVWDSSTHKGFMNIYVTHLHTQLSYLHYGFVCGLIYDFTSVCSFIQFYNIYNIQNI